MNPQSWSNSILLVLVVGCVVALGACSAPTSGTPPEEGAASASALGSVNVLTRGNDNQRTGANLAETTLTTSNVNSNQFGKLFELQVDDQIYAQPLYASGVSTAGGVHNVVYVATVNNTVYAFDADALGDPLWQRNFNAAGRATLASEVGSACGTYRDFSGKIGIVGTPVIDGTSQTMYFVTRTIEGTSTVQRLRAVDIATGSDRPASPVAIQASVPGTGDGTSGGMVAFNPVTNNQRPALALSDGAVYIAWSSFCDTGPYHGWVIAYDASSLAELGAFNTSPNAGRAGIWMAGSPPAFDSSGNLYFVTGNGSGVGAFDGNVNFSETVLKLAPQTLGRLDYFTPSNWASLDSIDADFGSAGTSFVPGTNRLVAGGKEGRVFLLNASGMGQLVSGDTQVPQIFQAVDPTVVPSGTHHIHHFATFWNSPSGLNMYVQGENDFLRSYRFDPTAQTFNTPASSVGSVLPPLGMPGGMLAVSANGSTSGSGIVWATTPRLANANQAVVPGIVRAYDASSLSLLWSSTAPADDTLKFAKFNPPVIANGKVYLASFSNMLSVFGLRSPLPPNLALAKTATGSAACATTETADKAVNGSITGGNGDKWCSNAVTRFLQVDLGSIQTIDRIVVRHACAGDESLSFNTRDFNLEVSSDGTNFTQVANVTGNTACNTTHSFSSTSARFVRLNIVTATQTTDTAARIYELEVYQFGGTCTPETDAAFCTRLGNDCGTVTGTDNCGSSRTVGSCGTCTSPDTCGGGGTANLCGGGTPADWTEGGTATGTGTACNTTTEDVSKAYDNLMTSATFSKWCVRSAPSTAAPISTVYDFAGTTAVAVTRYTITTGNDVASRDPRDWTLQACQGTCVVGSDAGWVTLDTEAQQFFGAVRYQTNTYTLTNGTAFQQYRLRFTANNGSMNRFQLAEIQMFAQ